MSEETDLARFRVVVVLRTGSSRYRAESPDVYPKAEAEELLASIREGKASGEEITLPWLAVDAEQVLVVHVERAEDAKPRSPLEILAMEREPEEPEQS
jgi:hypothetical protein